MATTRTLRLVIAAFLATMVVNFSVSMVFAQDEEEPLIIGTMLHDGLLWPWAVYDDSTFKPIYRWPRSDSSRDDNWVHGSVADSIPLWYVVTPGSLSTTETFGAAQFVPDDVILGWPTRPEGWAYQSSAQAPPGTPVLSQRVHYGLFFETADSAVSKVQGRIVAKMVGTNIGRIWEYARRGEYRLSDSTWSATIERIGKGDLQTCVKVATLDSLRFEFGDNGMWIDPHRDIFLSANSWGMYSPSEAWFVADLHVDQPKGLYHPDAVILVRHKGRLFVIGSVWSSADTGIWEVKGREVVLLFVHQERQG